jgi:hypothetical protein
MLASSSYATKMQYRSKHEDDPTKITDIFDGTHYCSLRETFITIGDEELPTWFFSDPRDVALGLSTDGFGPFKRRTKTAWPIILFNYNLPPKERFLKRNIISIGVIPGPKKPCDFDSFLWPLVQELLQLEIGLSAFDAITKVVFTLHAYLIIVFGDIPVVSMVMRMKGHNAIYPCRMCTIKGVRIPSLRLASDDALCSFEPRWLPRPTRAIRPMCASTMKSHVIHGASKGSPVCVNQQGL